MSEKSRLAEILGVEEDEEFTTKITSSTFRVHDGLFQCEEDPGEWLTAKCGILCQLISDPSLIIHKPRFSDEEMTFLRFLHKYGKVYKIQKSDESDGGTSCRTGNSRLMISNIGELLKPGEIVDLDELFKEEENGYT